MNKKIVVFGGSGFLGSYLSDALTESGYKVTIFDKITSPYVQKNQKMITGDILDNKSVTQAIKDADAVYHFASLAGIKDANKNPLEAVKQNILGTVNILDSCIKEKVEKFIFASTIYVYSEAGGIYRSTKQACELLIENYQKLFGINFTILRFGSIYGRRSNNFNWIHNTITDALTKGKMVREGDGEEIREYIHVMDAARASVMALDEKYKNDYVMLTGNHSIKIKDLLKMVSEMLENKASIEYTDGKMEGHYEVTPYTFRPRIAKKINLESEIELGQGILDVIYDIYKNLDSATCRKISLSIPD
jgi:UDP-glucose 4-epimerase